MAYTVINFKTKKALKAAVEKRQAYEKAKAEVEKLPILSMGRVMFQKYWPVVPPFVEAFQPGGIFPLRTGRNVIEGPHGYHKWYASVIINERHEVVKVTG